jgi:hypothetical protein
MTEDGAAADAGEESGAVTDALARLYALQTAPRRRWTATLGAAVAGLALVSVHWGGLVAGGALVGLCWPTLRRALVAGLGFGLAVIAVAATRFALAGTLADVAGAWPLVAIAVAAPLVAGPLGASVRGLFPDAPLARTATEKD